MYTVGWLSGLEINYFVFWDIKDYRTALSVHTPQVYLQAFQPFLI